MISFVYIKVKPASILVLLLACIVVMRPQPAAAAGVIVTDPVTEVETTDIAISDDTTAIATAATAATSTLSWADQLLNDADSGIDSVKRLLTKAIDMQYQKSLHLGPTNAINDNARATAIAAQIAHRTADAMRSDTTMVCAIAASRQVFNALHLNNQGIARQKVIYYGTEGNMQTKLPYQQTTTLKPLYNFCRLVNTGANPFSLSDLPYAKAQAMATTACSTIFANAS